jgi:hypothetical protein
MPSHETMHTQTSVQDKEVFGEMYIIYKHTHIIHASTESGFSSNAFALASV